LIIILLFCLFFGFKHGYGMTEQSDFILTKIKRCYNLNGGNLFYFLLGEKMT